MSAHNMHHDWLSLIEISGPFLAVPVLTEAFPQGLEALDGIERKRLRQAYDEWREAQETDDPQLPELHAAWIDEVLSRGLELDEDGKGDVLKRAEWCATHLRASLPEHGVTLSPDFAVIDEQRADKPLLLIHSYGQGVELDATLKLNGWAATPADRMVQLCRTLGCRLGLVTNGERWMLVDAPVGAVTTFASWYARIWSQEPITLQAFVHLLGIRRFFVDEAEQLPALFDRSLKYQDEVTDALGEQVRRAVEVLIQALDKADQDRDRELLRDVKEPELYEAALTVMMRLVFLLSAEERGLLLLGDERYEANYALSTLRMQLRKESEEILERRWDAWSRLLAIFRAVYGGIEHENLRLPALGGSLFDPDRFPFLEGRAKGSAWRTDAAKPLPIDNRTVLLLLEAIQQFQGRTLSYRALDVEQIGYVYEGLLERTVKRTAEVTLELDGTKNAKAPWVALAELESARLDGTERLSELLQERSGSSASRIRNDLIKPVDDALAERVLTACHGNTALRDRIKPFAHLVRTDPWGYPLVYPAGAFIVTTGSDRRETGTHYTPKSLTEAIVTETLTPIVYMGPAEGTPRDQWVLKSPAELLDLKICDPAMGSGAFLVQACRWLADRLVEAWLRAEANGQFVSIDGEVLDSLGTKEPLPRDTEARSIFARRLIAERCLYGVDLNPLAVELAKLSIWLVTLAKGRPFGFLDHNLRCGDSLLGINCVKQLTALSMHPESDRQPRLYGQAIQMAIDEAIKLRQQIRGIRIRDIHDVDLISALDAKAKTRLEALDFIADAFIGVALVARDGRSAAARLDALAIEADRILVGAVTSLVEIGRQTTLDLATDSLNGHPRKPFHWPLEFPEVFARQERGFDALVGNPPYYHGSRISSAFGSSYLQFLLRSIINTVGKADLCAYFVRKSFDLLGNSGCLGLLLTNSISEGENLKSAITPITLKGGVIYSATTDIKWPGSASVVVSILNIAKRSYTGPRNLNGEAVASISNRLTAENLGEPLPLKTNLEKCFKGSELLGDFFISKDQAENFIKENRKYATVVRPFFGGKTFTSQSKLAPDRWVIYFADMSLEDASEEYPHLVDFLRSRFFGREENAPKRKKWWQFHRPRSSMYFQMNGLKRILLRANTSNMCWFEFGECEWVISNTVVVILDDSIESWGVLNSSLHEAHTYIYAGRMRTDIQYTPSTCFGYFPMPEHRNSDLRHISESYRELRCRTIEELSMGMMGLYKKFHDKKDISPSIANLRTLHKELDCAVAAQYGWGDIDLEHDFHETKQGLRFTFSENARIEIIKRLLKLNHDRYKEEVLKGLHATSTERISSSIKRTTARLASHNFGQPGLDFDG